MIEYIFYGIGLVFMLDELIIAFNPMQRINYVKKSRKRLKEHGMSLDLFLYWIFGISYAIWGVIGLFTSQKILFITLWIAGWFFPTHNKYGRIADSSISALMLIAIILNKYVLELDIFRFLMEIVIFMREF